MKVWDSQTVWKLRTKTGLPVNACKEALIEAGGDMDRAEFLVRLRLKEKMDKRSEKPVVPQDTSLSSERLFDLEWERGLLERELAVIMKKLGPICAEIARRYGGSR